MCSSDLVGVEDCVWATTEFLSALAASNKPHDELYAPGNITNPSFFKSIGIEDPRPRLLRIAYFYESSRWFRRAWVIQEALLARHGRFFCGQIEFSVSKACDLADILRETQWSTQISQSMEMPENNREIVWLEEIFRWRVTAYSVKPWIEAFNANRRASPGAEEPFTWLWKVLSLSRYGECQDKRDKIYSILGIASRYFINTPISHFIKPDYDILPKDLFTRITIQIIENSSPLNLDVLSYVGERPKDPDLIDLPSWVPDYTSPVTAQPFTTLNVKYDAALRSSSGCPELRLSMTKLLCTGAQFQTIEEVHELTLCGSRSRHLSFLQLCLSMSRQENGRPQIEPFWRTLIANNSLEPNEPAPSSIEASFLALVKIFSAQCIWEATRLGMDPDIEFQLLSSVLDQLDLSNVLDQQLKVEDVRSCYELLMRSHAMNGESMEDDIAKARQPASAYISLMSFVIPGRRLFRTEQGCLGLGPSTAQKGDQIWLLCNGDVPFVLRPTAETPNFTLIGECYIHGFMHGEMLQSCWGLKEKIGPVHIV